MSDKKFNAIFTCPMRREVNILFIFILMLSFQSHDHLSVSACSSRSIPKPRPSTSSIAASTRSVSIISTSTLTTSSTATSTVSTTTSTSTTTTTTTTTPRPNITFPTYKCPANYDAWYCLNDAHCFSIKIGESVMYNCECAIGFMGPRCEYKELDGSYLPKRPRPILEKASIANVATCALLFMVFLCLVMYLRYDQRIKSYEEEYAEILICRYCHDSRCCGKNEYLYEPFPVEKFRNNEYGIKSILQALSVGFAVKGSTKM